MMLRALMGEAGIDARGLWIDDRQQGWSLRVGDIQGELLQEAATRLERRMVRSIAGAGPIWGVHFGKEF